MEARVGLPTPRRAYPFPIRSLCAAVLLRIKIHHPASEGLRLRQMGRYYSSYIRCEKNFNVHVPPTFSPLSLSIHSEM